MDVNQSDSMQDDVSEQRFPSVVQLSSEPINIQVNPQVGLPTQIVTSLPPQPMPFHQQMPPMMPQVGAISNRIEAEI